MTNQGTAGIVVESGKTSALIEASLLSLGFLPLTLRDPEQSGPDHSGANQFAMCELIIAEEARADAVRSAIPHSLIENPRLPPALIVLRDAGAPEDAVTDLNFDGILQLPFTSEEVTLRLRDIVHAHRSLIRRCLPLLDELSLSRGVMRSVTNGITIADATLPDLPLIYINPAFRRSARPELPLSARTGDTTIRSYGGAGRYPGAARHHDRAQKLSKRRDSVLERALFFAIAR
jgi:hypothetical protein